MTSVTMRLLLLLVTLLQLSEGEKLPFGARLGVRRVRSKATSSPFLINWASLNKSPRKEKQLQQFPYLPPPNDLDYGDEDGDVPAPDDSFQPVFDIPVDSEEEVAEASNEPPLINPDIPGVIINPVYPSPPPDTDGFLQAPDPVSVTVPQTISNDAPISLEPGPWQTVSKDATAPLEPGPWIPVSNPPETIPQSSSPLDPGPWIQVNNLPETIPQASSPLEPGPWIQVNNLPETIPQVSIPLESGPWIPVNNLPETIPQVTSELSDPVVTQYFQPGDIPTQDFSAPVIQESPAVEVPDQDGVTSPRCQTVTETVLEQQEETRCRIVNESACYQVTLDSPTQVAFSTIFYSCVASWQDV